MPPLDHPARAEPDRDRDEHQSQRLDGDPQEPRRDRLQDDDERNQPRCEQDDREPAPPAIWLQRERPQRHEEGPDQRCAASRVAGRRRPAAAAEQEPDQSHPSLDLAVFVIATRRTVEEPLDVVRPRTHDGRALGGSSRAGPSGSRPARAGWSRPRGRLVPDRTVGMLDRIAGVQEPPSASTGTRKKIAGQGAHRRPPPARRLISTPAANETSSARRGRGRSASRRQPVRPRIRRAPDRRPTSSRSAPVGIARSSRYRPARKRAATNRSTYSAVACAWTIEAQDEQAAAAGLDRRPRQSRRRPPARR